MPLQVSNLLTQCWPEQVLWLNLGSRKRDREMGSVYLVRGTQKVLCHRGMDTGKGERFINDFNVSAIAGEVVELEFNSMFFILFS